ncbi:MAG: amino acid--tRNA ligase-related protein [Pseudomonadota bacterium]
MTYKKYTKGFEFCWIEDFPFFKLDSHSGKLDFNHNPFSKLHTNDWGDHLSQDELLKIKAYQFDIVCNGYELGSGALRNHSADMLYKLFEMVGYDQAYVDQKFNALLTGLKFGAPPHGGIALGVDRIIMLLSGKSSIREVVAFPVNQNGIDHLMKAPNTLDNDFLMDLGIVVNNDDKK